jgi:hypothetical protein
MRNISKTALLILLLSKVSLSFAAAKGSSPLAPVPVTGESSTTVGAASGVRWSENRFVSGRGATESCITDKLTGLMWPKNGNLFKKQMNWIEADAAVNDMDKNEQATAYKLCGYDDWRLPTVTELKSLVKYDGQRVPYGWFDWLNDRQGFNNVQASFYWSSTSHASSYTDSAWGVHFDYGGVNAYNKNFNFYVWPVRRVE